MKGVIRRVSSEVYEQELEAFLFGHPAQVALLGLQFQWTADMQVQQGGQRALGASGGNAEAGSGSKRAATCALLP